MAKKPRLNVPSIPNGLGVHGRELWKSIQAEYGIADVGGMALLFHACAGEDRAEDCRESIERDGSLIQTKGGPRAHPLIREELNARAFVVRTLQKLGVTLEPVKPMGRPPTKVGVSFRDDD
jgi:hypothetical protein